MPRRPDEGAYAALAEAGIDAADIHELVHGSTVATNAVMKALARAVPEKVIATGFDTTTGPCT